MRLVSLVGENRWRLLVLASACACTLIGGFGCGALGFVFPEPALGWNDAFYPLHLHGEWRGGKECSSYSLGSRLRTSGPVSMRKPVYDLTTGRNRMASDTRALPAFILPYDQISDGELYSAKSSSSRFFGGKRGGRRTSQMRRRALDALWWIRRRGVSIASATVLAIAVIFSSPVPSRAGLFDFLEGDIYVNSPQRLTVRASGFTYTYTLYLHLM